MANHPTLPEAIKVLQEALMEDKEPGSYYYSWQANIAMAFVDNERWYRERTGKSGELTQEDLHLISNDAAKYFLDQFCK